MPGLVDYWLNVIKFFQIQSLTKRPQDHTEKWFEHQIPVISPGGWGGTPIYELYRLCAAVKGMVFGNFTFE